MLNYVFSQIVNWVGSGQNFDFYPIMKWGENGKPQVSVIFLKVHLCLYSYIYKIIVTNAC